MSTQIETVEDQETDEEVIIPEDENTQQDEETEEPEADQGEMQDQQSEAGESDSESDGSEEDDEEEVVLIGGESPPQDDEDDDGKSPLVPKLRGEIKERNKENRDLRKRLEALEAKKEDEEATATLPPLGKEPEYEDTFDGAQFKAQWNQWNALKQKHDEAKATAKATAEEQKQSWDNRLKEYETKKSALKVSDFDDAEDIVNTKLSTTQKGIIVHGAENSAVLTYAIGKLEPEEFARISGIQDPVKFAFAAGKLETQLKVAKRKRAKKPERKVQGGARMESHDSTLDRLEADAEKSGNRTKVLAYKRKQKLAKQQKS